jgi:hypothetical protein
MSAFQTATICPNHREHIFFHEHIFKTPKQLKLPSSSTKVPDMASAPPVKRAFRVASGGFVVFLSFAVMYAAVCAAVG